MFGKQVVMSVWFVYGIHNTEPLMMVFPTREAATEFAVEMGQKAQTKVHAMEWAGIDYDAADPIGLACQVSLQPALVQVGLRKVRND